MPALYNIFAFVGGAAYLQLYLWIMNPKIMIFVANSLFEGDLTAFTEDQMRGYRTLLTMVCPIGYMYIYAAAKNLTDLIDITILWRLLWVAPWILLSTLSGDPVQKSVACVIAALDVGLPVMALLCCPNERAGILDRVREHFTREAKTDSEKVLKYVSRIGIVFSLWLATSNYDIEGGAYMQAFSLAIIAIYHLFFDYFSRNSHVPTFFVAFIMFQLISAIILGRFVYGYEKPHAMEAQLIFSLVAGLCYLYTLAWDKFVVKGKMNYTLWGGINSAVVIVISLLWVMCKPLFVAPAQVISVNQHRFDILLSIFIFETCFVMEEIRNKVKFHPRFLAWFAPFLLYWYSTAVKVMINLNLGSPYHPSWKFKGLTDTDYNPTQPVMDISYGIVTITITLIATTYGAVLTFLYFDHKGWRTLSVNGFLLILLSAYFMLAFSSGFASMTKPPHSFPPNIPKIGNLNPVYLINTHVRDIIAGLSSMVAGLALDAFAPASSVKYCKYVIGMIWTLSIMSKIYLFFDIEIAMM